MDQLIMIKNVQDSIQVRFSTLDYWYTIMVVKLIEFSSIYPYGNTGQTKQC